MQGWGIPEPNCTRSVILMKATFEMSAYSQLLPFSSEAAYRNYASGAVDVALRQYAALAELGRGTAMDNAAFLFAAGHGAVDFDLTSATVTEDRDVTKITTDSVGVGVNVNGEVVDMPQDVASETPTPDSSPKASQNNTASQLRARAFELYSRGANEV